MGDSAPPPYPGDRESRLPRKHRHDQRNGRSDSHSEDQDRYSSDRTQSRNQNERSHNRHQDRDQYRKDREPSRPREEPSRSRHQHYENREPSRPREEPSRSQHQHYEDREPSRPREESSRSQHQHYEDREPSRPSEEPSQSRHQYYEDREPSRPREEPSRSQHQHYEKRVPSRNQRDRGRDGHRERGHHYEDRGTSRNQSERSCDHYQDSDRYLSERSYNQYQGSEDDPKERSRNREREREQEYYKHSSDRQGYPEARKDSEHYYPSERYPPNGSQMYDMDYSEEPEGGILDCHKCRYLCTGRGVLQMLEVLLNGLVLICLISSYFVLSGFSAGMASGGFGGGYYPFEGQELQEVRQLDQEFTLLRAPLLYGGLTVSLLMGTLTLAILAAGSKHLLRLSDRWLIIESAFSLVGSLGYGAATGVFLHFALQINATDVCKRRERLYARNGLTWMNCDLAGTDGGAAAFAILLVILYGASVVLAIRAYRERRSLQQ